MDLDNEEFNIFGSDVKVFKINTYYNYYKVNNLFSNIIKILGKLENVR